MVAFVPLAAGDEAPLKDAAAYTCMTAAPRHEDADYGFPYSLADAGDAPYTLKAMGARVPPGFKCVVCIVDHLGLSN